MNLENDFEVFCEAIKLDNLDEIIKTVRSITRKLNSHYYEIVNDEVSNMYIVGSVGRNTAVKNCSDLDILFNLPHSLYEKYDNYKSNGQSSLLQDVKKVLKERYSKTELRGDGQVVVIDFNKYTVELVPGFIQPDNSFKYPDSNGGGLWKKTDPLREQLECSNVNKKSNGLYYDFCHLMRKWKNNIGFACGGLLIDTLVYNYFKANSYFNTCTYKDYYDILINLFGYIKSLDKERLYWFAIGSNQHVYNKDNGKFINKANEAYESLKNINENECNNVLQRILGTDFPANEMISEYASVAKSYTYKNTEMFIENMYPIDIKYNMEIDCKVNQNGFRAFFLSNALKTGIFLKHNKKLEFFIKECKIELPYKIFWKVRNVGAEAERRNNIRGQIIETNEPNKIENTQFRGPHYVECYIVKNNVCVARAHIDVPIGNE